MKTKVLLLLMITILSTSCSGVRERSLSDLPERRIDILFSFNTENYPWMLGTKYPQLAVWVEPETGDPETIFVTRGAGKNKWMFADERPGALPVWTGARPGINGIDIDAVSGATPSGDVHAISWPVPGKYDGKRLSIFIEANVSFDYNDFYTKDESSPGFSDVNGQPSLVWRSVVHIDGSPSQTTPEIIGHGHVLGKNSAIDSDLSGVTNATDLFKYIEISYHPGF